MNYRRQYVGPRLRLPRQVWIALVLAIFVGAGLFGWRKYADWRQRQAVAAIQSAGGIIVKNAAGDVDRVHLAGPRIGDAQIKDLAAHLKWLRLRQLDLVGDKISDESLRRLRGQLRVSTVHIFQTKASEQGIADLSQSLPRTQIKRTAPDPIATQLAARDIHRHAVVSLLFTPDGRHLLSGSGDGKLRLWDLRTSTPLATIASHEKWLFSIALSPDGATIATAGGDRLIHLYDLKALLSARGERPLAPLRTLTGHTNDVHAVAFLDAHTLASAGDDGTLRLWDPTTGAIRRVIDAHDRAIPALALSRDRRLIATASRDNTVKLWNIDTGSLLHTLPHTDDVNAVSFSADGTRLASASYDGSVRLWDPATGQLQRQITGHAGRVFTVAFNPAANQLISGGADGTLRLWTLDGNLLESSTDQQLPAAIAFSPTPGHVATSSAEGTILLRTPQTLATHRMLLPDYEPLAAGHPQNGD